MPNAPCRRACSSRFTVRAWHPALISRMMTRMMTKMTNQIKNKVTSRYDAATVYLLDGPRRLTAHAHVGILQKLDQYRFPLAAQSGQRILCLRVR